MVQINLRNSRLKQTTMGNPHSHDHVCTHCGCNNPVINFMKKDLFHPENMASLAEGLIPFIGKDPENLVISGGTIRPMINGSTDTVDAIGIYKGKVAVTGTLQEVTDFMNKNHYSYTSKELSAGQTLLPGLIEPHVHIVPSALMMSWIDVTAFEGQLLRKPYDKVWLTATLLNNKPIVPEFWILATGLDPAFFPYDGSNLITITNDWLDEITTEKEILILSASGHTMYLNTKALTTVYNSSSELQSQYATVDDYIKATKGQLQEEVMMAPALAAIPKLQYAEVIAGAFSHLTELFQQANALGVTFMYDAGMTSQYQDILKPYLLSHDKTVRIGAAHMCMNIDDVKNAGNYQQPTEYSDVYYGHIKLISDGSNQGLTGYQSEYYLCNPQHNYGVFNFLDPVATDPSTEHPTVPTDTYRQLVDAAITQQGWPMMIHANGDLAIQMALDVYKDYANPSAGLRHRIEHCSLLTTAVDNNNIATMKELGISPSFLIGHVGYWGYAFQQIIFGAKSQMLDLCKSSLDAGLKITLHSDHSVSPLGPLRMMEQSITRIMEADPKASPTNPACVLNAPECLTAEDALIAATNFAAWQCYADKWVGSLDVGYFADFTILEQDPLSMTQPYMNMRNIPVLETWKEAVQVYKNASHTVPSAAAMI